MYFRHAPQIWRGTPGLVPGVILADGITPNPDVGTQVARFEAIAADRLQTASPGQLPEVQAWRRVFSSMGLKPTQYRCAAESLLRRFSKDGNIPRIHPLIDLCNAISLAFAVPVAVFDVAKVEGHLEVRPARGDETYTTLAGEDERPDAGEVIFGDDGGRAHARRWTNRQSGHSAVRDTTSTVLIVAEAMHESAATDVPRLTATIESELNATWAAATKTAVLRDSAPQFDF